MKKNNLKLLISFLSLAFAGSASVAHSEQYSQVLCAAQMTRLGYYKNIEDSAFLQQEGTDVQDFRSTSIKGLSFMDSTVRFPNYALTDSTGHWSVRFEVNKVEPELIPWGFSRNKWNPEKPLLEVRATLQKEIQCQESKRCQQPMSFGKFDSNAVIHPDSLRLDVLPEKGRLIVFGQLYVTSTLDQLEKLNHSRVTEARKEGELPFLMAVLSEGSIDPMTPYTIDIYCYSMYDKMK